MQELHKKFYVDGTSKSKYRELLYRLQTNKLKYIRHSLKGKQRNKYFNFTDLSSYSEFYDY